MTTALKQLVDNQERLFEQIKWEATQYQKLPTYSFSLSLSLSPKYWDYEASAALSWPRHWAGEEQSNILPEGQNWHSANSRKVLTGNTNSDACWWPPVTVTASHLIVKVAGSNITLFWGSPIWLLPWQPMVTTSVPDQVSWCICFQIPWCAHLNLLCLSLYSARDMKWHSWMRYITVLVYIYICT